MKKDAIRKLRLSMKLTQEAFAHALGVTRAAVAKWEAGDFKPSPLAMIQIERLSKRPLCKNCGADIINSQDAHPYPRLQHPIDLCVPCRVARKKGKASVKRKS